MRNVRNHVKPHDEPKIAQVSSQGVTAWRRSSSMMIRGVLGRGSRVVLPWDHSTPSNGNDAVVLPQQTNKGDSHRRSSSGFHNIRRVANGAESQQVLAVLGPQQRRSCLLSHLREIPDATTEVSDHEPNLLNGRREALETLEDTLAPRQEHLLSPPTLSKQPSDLKSQICIFGYSLAPLYDFWERLQVCHCGQYSVERMLALDEYCQRVSVLRVLAVCFLFPLGPLLVVILTECMPLQPVEKGALANHVFWIRHTLIGIILIVCAMVQAKVWIPEMALSMTQVIVVAIGSAAAYTSLNIIIAHLWVFPIPFLVVAGAPLLFSIWALASRMALGPRPMAGIEDGDFRGRRFLMLTSVHAALLGIYPAYQAFFLAMDGGFQLLVVAMMPVMNLALKNLQTVWGSHLEDSLPEVIVFTCDVFGTIYSVLCMHSANSMKMVAVTVALNAFVVVMNLYGMNRRSRVARANRTFHVAQSQQQRALPVLETHDDSETLNTLVIATVKLLQVPGQLDSTELSDIRLLSGMQHRLSEENAALLTSLRSRSVYNNDRQTFRTVTMGQMKSRYATAAIEGRKFSSSHFVVPPPPRSKIVQRLHATVIVVPVVKTRFTAKPRRRAVSLQFFRRGSRDKVSRESPNTGTFPRLPLRSSLPLNQNFLRSPPLLNLSLKHHRKASSTASRRFSVTSERLETSSKVLPLVRTSNPVIGNVLEETRKQNTRAVKQTLGLLFNNEYLGLISYTQCFIPIIYLLYMPLLRAMPNHAFYPTHYRYFGDLRDFDQRMIVIAALTALQFAAFVAVQVFVSKRFGVSTIYQVAFVLESQFLFLQGRLLIWLVYAVQSTLVHYGADFTFQFAWVTMNSATSAGESD